MISLTKRKYDYHPFINDWLKAVEQNKVHSSTEIKQLMNIIRKTLDNPRVFFDVKQVEKYVELTEKYYFKLMPDQKFYASLILGLYYKDTKQLVFPNVFIMAGRGWGKNGFISTLADFMLTEHHGVEKYDVDIVATSEEQAMTSFNEVYDKIEGLGKEKAKALYDYNLTKITYRKTRSTLKYRTSSAKTKDGGRPGCVIFDEIHAYEDYDNIKVFTGGLGKVPRPRRIYITTDGEIREGVLDDYKERARRILEGETDHKGFLPIIMKLDNIQEVGKPDLWDKANPRINYDETLKGQIFQEYEEMLEIEALKEAFITKRMNLSFVSKTKTVCSWDDLMACCKLQTPDLTGLEAIGSVDFADLRDFACAGLRFKKDGKQYFISHAWVHETSLELTNYNVDLKQAAKDGELTIIKKNESPTIPPEVLADWFLEQVEENSYYIKTIKCDSFRYGAIKEVFESRGLPKVELIRSGTISHNLVAPVLDTLLANHELGLPDSKLFRWFVWNVKRETDKKGNVAYYKIEPIKRKTDGFFCLLHSLIGDDLEEAKEMITLPVYTY